MKSEHYRNNRVLVVDDRKEIHDDFVEMLTPDRSGHSSNVLAAAFIDEEPKFDLPEFEILHAARGEEALQIVQEARDSGNPIAAAFVDIRMPPGIDGVETIRRVRRIDRDLEIVIMTAYTDWSLSDIIQDMDLLHKLLYIRKPFVCEEIQQITLSLVAKWNIERDRNEKRQQLVDSHQKLVAGMVGASSKMLQLCRLIRQAADSNITFAHPE